MLSSDSGDSEDDSDRFREACDPKLSVTYEENNVFEAQYDDHNLQIEEKVNGLPNAKISESRLLVKKIQHILSSNAGNQRGHSSLKSKNSGIRNVFRRKRLHTHSESFSSISPYLGNQLIKLLDKRVQIQEQDSAKPSLGCVSKSQSELFLLKDVPIQTVLDNPDKLTSRKPRVTPLDSIDKKELKLRCQSVALSPDYILEKKDVYPWHDPKNIRYLETYTVKKKMPNGLITVVPYNDVSSVTKERAVTKVHIASEEKNQLKETVNKKTDARTSSGNLKPDGLNLENEIDEHSIDNQDARDVKTKKRKQSRKRGGKNKNTNKALS